MVPNVNARDPDGNTPLILAAVAETGHDYLAHLFDLLKGRGADFNASNREGETALMAAAEAGEDDAVRLLLERGADPHRRDHRGRTAVACT